MGSNLLSDNVTKDWRVFFNAPLTGHSDYTPNDQDIIKTLAEQRRNLLSLADSTSFKNDDSNLVKLISVLQQLADKSAVKELDVLYALANNDEEKIASINNIYRQTREYFENLKVKQLSNINYDQKDLKVLNTLFWSDPNEKDRDGQVEFIKALSAMRAQDFFVNGATSRLQTLGSGTSTFLEDHNYEDWYKNNMISAIVDIVETDNKYKAAAAKDIKSGGKVPRASVGIILKRAGEISKKLSDLLLIDIKKELEKAYNQAIEEAQQKGASIPPELSTFEGARSQATYNQNIARSLYAKYTIEVGKDVVKVVAVTGSAFTTDQLIQTLKENITNELSNRNENEYFTEESLGDFLKKVVSDTVRGLEVKFNQTIEVNIQGIIEKVSSDKKLIDLLDDYLLINGASEDEVKKRVEFIKKNIDKEINNVLNFWCNILREEIPSINNINNQEALRYFNSIEDKLKSTIISDLSMENSSLENEVLKAVEQYYKISWGGSGKKGHISLFNGTIGEIFATYLLRQTLSSFGGTALQQGASLQEGKQAIADIELQYQSGGKIKSVGLQLKQYKSNAISLYGEEKFISLMDAQRYLTQEEIDSFLFLMGNQPTLKLIGDNTKSDFSDLVPYLYYRLDGFLRIKHAKLDLEKDLQNNFYIFNFNVIPTSIIFLFYAYKIREEFLGDDYNISIFGLEGSTEENHFTPGYAYNSYEEINRSSNLLSKLQSFKIRFKGKTINIDNSDSLLSVFRKKG